MKKLNFIIIFTISLFCFGSCASFKYYDFEYFLDKDFKHIDIKLSESTTISDSEYIRIYDDFQLQKVRVNQADIIFDTFDSLYQYIPQKYRFHMDKSEVKKTFVDAYNTNSKFYFKFFIRNPDKSIGRNIVHISCEPSILKSTLPPIKTIPGVTVVREKKKANLLTYLTNAGKPKITTYTTTFNEKYFQHKIAFKIKLGIQQKVKGSMLFEDYLDLNPPILAYTPICGYLKYRYSEELEADGIFDSF